MGGKNGQGEPWDVGNINKSNSKQVNYLREALIEDKVELENCKIRLLCILFWVSFFGALKLG